MSFRWSVDMREAARLTRRGRLGEALVKLRSGLAQGRRKLADEEPRANPTPADPRWQGPGTGRAGSLASSLPSGLGPAGGRWPAPFSLGDGQAAFMRKRADVVVPAGAKFESGLFSSLMGQLAYRLYVPSTYRQKPMPLVVMLHGCTQSPEDFALGTGMNDVAEEQGLLVVYPEQSKAANTTKCWNWFRPEDQSREVGEPALIAGMIRQIMSTHAVDGERVYVAGLSAGGAAAAIMGAAYPDLFAAVGVHSGLPCRAARDLPSALAVMRHGGPRGEGGRATIPLPTIVFHGDQDKTVHPSNGNSILDQAGRATRSPIFEAQGSSPGGMNYTRLVLGDDAGRPVLEQWRLHGAGHAWSGGSANGSYTDPRGPDASREMVRFFAGHRKNAKTGGR